MKLRCCSESLSHKKHVDRQLVRRDEQSGQISPYCSNTYVLPPIIFAHREKESIVFCLSFFVGETFNNLEQRNFIRFMFTA